ncbi:MerR family transcriptional regulator [Mesobacillus campisalis]|uniref:MerR family transcriptional regulator n=1 Tax=Mesobacillus campisalis TaxID=1408103 RepID=UPI00069BF185|nr:MerR family transcriptional regulator [Mesobacillus campisalis]
MYNIKAISKILDMPTVTIRSWETRYNAITPIRTEAGHRVYTEEHLHDLKWLKKQVQDKGIAISQAVKLLHAKKEQAEEEMAADGVEQPYETQIKDLLTAVHDLDAERCNFLLDLYFSQFPHKTVFFSILVPLMYKVGEEWEKGSLYVAKEHMISNIVMQRAMKFFSIFQPQPGLPKVMAICPEGEQHQLGLIMFVLFLKEKHYPVYYIGANTPLQGLGELIRDKDIDILAISTTSKKNETTINTYIDTLSEQNSHLKFLVGGSGVQKSKAADPRWDIAPADQPKWLEILSSMIDK